MPVRQIQECPDMYHLDHVSGLVIIKNTARGLINLFRNRKEMSTSREVKLIDIVHQI